MAPIRAIRLMVPHHISGTVSTELRRLPSGFLFYRTETIIRGDSATMDCPWPRAWRGRPLIDLVSIYFGVRLSQPSVLDPEK